ncbi:MAG: hypothetical protein LBU89_01665 [Fibromonadaceae bacterium]|jgi:hypothetical protein|nr:hypothetical protein [Fibromonadaceae bacterium]
MRLQTNFQLAEFTKTAWNKLDKRTQIQLIALANTLQAIRTAIGRPIVVSSGVRSLDDYKRLQTQGLNPSATSDHFFGAEVPRTNSAPYKLALGAADIVCPSMPAVEFYNFIAKMRYEGKIQTGQLLLEKNKTMWLHIANHPDPFLLPEEKVQRTERSLGGMGYSLDNGKTFTWLNQAKRELLPIGLK